MAAFGKWKEVKAWPGAMSRLGWAVRVARPQRLVTVTSVPALVRYLQRTGRADRDTNTAEELLAERFAHGEIDEEEYRRRMTALAERRRRT
ncbi:hypothetical protein ACWDKQ_27535 [Saccharopolyspora sp. NPDC000995]